MRNPIGEFLRGARSAPCPCCPSDSARRTRHSQYSQQWSAQIRVPAALKCPSPTLERAVRSRPGFAPKSRGFKPPNIAGNTGCWVRWVVCGPCGLTQANAKPNKQELVYFLQPALRRTQGWGQGQADLTTGAPRFLARCAILATLAQPKP